MTSPSPRLVDPPDTLWRVARIGRGQDYSRITPTDAASRSAGNRFDVPGGGVLYAASDLEGCYRETLARLRPAPALLQLNESNENAFMKAGQIAASWRESRRIFQIGVRAPLPFVDVEHQETWNVLDQAVMSPSDPYIDVAQIRGPDRILTRRIANWVYTQVNGDDSRKYSGIRYLSRTGDFECWAIFDNTGIDELAPAGEISAGDPTLRRVAAAYRLTIH